MPCHVPRVRGQVQPTALIAGSWAPDPPAGSSHCLQLIEPAGHRTPATATNTHRGSFSPGASCRLISAYRRFSLSRMLKGLRPTCGKHAWQQHTVREKSCAT